MTYKLGSLGPEVAQIQERLTALSLYRGPNDAHFGGGTEAAVRAFQKAKGLAIDGQVGPTTWKRLFPKASMPTPSIASKPLGFRCLALTGAIETGTAPPDCFAGLAGDFDGQGMSFGALQWNFGQQTLQSLLKEMNEAHADELGAIFGSNYAALVAALGDTPEQQMSWCRSLQNSENALIEPWRGQFKTLGRTDSFQEIEVEHASLLYDAARTLAKTYAVTSQRAAALFFDIKVQNGAISAATRAEILNDVAALTPSGDVATDEVAKLRIIANRRANAASPRWREDVRNRKLVIANGEGTIHGMNFDLESQYGITLEMME